MNIPFTRLKDQYYTIKGEVDKAIHTCFEESRFLGGEQIHKFENQFAIYNGINHCITCANGSDAIEVALQALEIGLGDEVIVPTHTWITTISSIVNSGATPVLVDTTSDFLLNENKIEKKLTKKTKAILCVHLFGNINSIEILNIIAKEHNLYLIEDCAQAHGAKYKGKKSGSVGDVATFSFFPSKNLGAFGDAGAIITNSESVANKARLIANKGQVNRNEQLIWGRNSGMDSIQAAILSVKLNYLDQWNQKRQEIAQLYNDSLNKNKVTKPKLYLDGSHVYHQYVIKVNNRDELKEHLLKNNVETNIHYPQMIHEVLMMKGKTDITTFIEANHYKTKILSLPIYPELKQEEVSYIVNLINEFCQ